MALNIKAASAAFLVVDVQRVLFRQPVPIFGADEIIARINILTKLFHTAGAPVVFIQHANKSKLIEESEGWLLVPELDAREDDLFVRKRHGDAFRETVLAERLKALNVDTLIIAGLTTHGCVQASCRGAAAAGFRVVLVQDAHSSYHKDAEELIERWNRTLAAEGTEVVRAEEIRLE